MYTIRIVVSVPINDHTLSIATKPLPPPPHPPFDIQNVLIVPQAGVSYPNFKQCDRRYSRTKGSKTNNNTLMSDTDMFNGGEGNEVSVTPLTKNVVILKNQTLSVFPLHLNF